MNCEKEICSKDCSEVCDTPCSEMDQDVNVCEESVVCEQPHDETPIIENEKPILEEVTCTDKKDVINVSLGQVIEYKKDGCSVSRRGPVTAINSDSVVVYGMDVVSFCNITKMF